MYYVSIIVQQVATVYSLFISANRSTCFVWYLHPSSGAHNTVSTVSGITETFTVTCRERDWMGIPIHSPSDTVDRVIWAPDDGWRYHPKHVEQLTDINCIFFHLFGQLLTHITRFTDHWTLIFWRRNYFFLILAHPVHKMWIIREPNTLELWNKLHFEGKNWEYIPCLKYSIPIFVE